MKEALTALTAIFCLGVLAASGECPPDLHQFLTLNGESYKSSSPAVVRVRAEREEREVVVASLGLRENKCYSSLSCRLVRGGELLTVREGQECQVSVRSLARTAGPDGAPVTLSLTSRISPGLAPNCSSASSTSVSSFTVEFCSPNSGDNCYNGEVHYIETNFNDIGDDVILQRERKVPGEGEGDGVCARSASLQESSSSSLTWPLLTVWILMVLLATLAVLGYCWSRGCFG